MATSDLIDRLVTDLAPVRRGAVARRIALGIVAGVLVSTVGMMLTIGPRPDIGVAMATGAFWMKFAYTALLAAIGAAAVVAIARPEGGVRNAALAGLLVLAACALLAMLQLTGAPALERPTLIVGETAAVCPWNIVILSLPVFAGTFWALRGLAPTRLTLAGATAGLAAGAFGALVYSFHCPESTMPFLAIWYTAGVAIAGVVGGALGRWLLRW
ncbi:MAG: DUF1109 domain-containing protein [Bauldia sp.]